MKSETIFDFTKIGSQGAYISTFTPQRLSEYLNEIIIPQESSYHVVGCYYPNYISKMNSWDIVEKYLIASEVQRRTIIDLCLPYHDDHSKKTYLGRYIIYSGYLVGIRLNTNNTLIAPYYSSWPKHKTKVAIFSSGNHKNNNQIMIGQFSLHLINARIGLLFEAELKTSANEYINCGYDIIVLNYETLAPESKVIIKKNEISKKTFLVESKMGYFDECITKKQIEGFGSSTIELPKNTIYIDYCQLSKVFLSKQYLKLSQKVEFDVRCISIMMGFTQPREKKYTYSQQKMASIYNISSHIEKPLQEGLNHLSTDASSDVFLKRLLKIFFLCNRRKIILILEESPTTICFLYVIRTFLEIIKTTQSSLNISEFFTIINLQNARLNLIAQKFDIFTFTPLNEDSSENVNDHFDSRLIKTLEDIMNQQKNQQFFAIITSNTRIENIVRLLNERQNSLLLQHYESNIDGSGSGSGSVSLSVECVNKRQIKLQSWLVCQFFSLQQLKSVYFSSQIKSIIDDRKYHGQLWLKQVNPSQASRQNKCQNIEDVIDLDLDNLEITASIYKINLDHLLRQDNLIIYQFNEFITRLQQRGCFGLKNEVFPHYLFRKVTVMSSFHSPSYILKSCMNILEEFIITDKQYLYPLFQLITHYHCSLSERIQHRLTLRKIAHIRQQHLKHIQCHRCIIKYPLSLIFRCKDINCGESFCYQCLVDVKLIESHLLKESNKNVSGELKLSNCPACLGLCDSGCKKCSIKFISAKLRKGQTIKSGRSQCHFCYQANALHYYVCSDQDCKRMFCKRCIEEYYKDKKKEYQQINWKCYVCRQTCLCNNCEIDRARFMKIVERMGVQQEVQKQLNKQTKSIENEAKEEMINFVPSKRKSQSLQDPSLEFKDNLKSKQSLHINDNIDQIDNIDVSSFKRQLVNHIQNDDFDANLTPLWKIDMKTGEVETKEVCQKKKKKKKQKSEPLAFKQATLPNIKIEAIAQQQKKQAKTKIIKDVKPKQTVRNQEQDTRLTSVPSTQNKVPFNFPQLFANLQFDY